MEHTLPATVGILTYNSGKTLERCLRSVQNFDDIIICDGGSTDETIAIAKKYGARIIEQDNAHKKNDGTIADFSGVRNQMLKAAEHEWFFFVDSDEYISDELNREIKAIVESRNPKVSAYWVPRMRVYNDQVVDCSTTYPNYQMRLFHKSVVTGFIKAVHERIQLKPGVKTAKTTQVQYVPFEYTREEWKAKLNYYISIEIERHKEQKLFTWVRYTFFNTCKLHVLYALRLVRLSLFCKGHKMPLWYETMQFWYHRTLAWQTFKKYL